jgi:hypothetical protein
MTRSPAAALDPGPDVRPLAPSALIGGIGGLAFAATVVLQNIVRATYPANDAGAATVIDYYAAHRGTAVLLAVLFPIGALGLAAMIGATVARIGRGNGRAAAYAGLLGAAGVVATFTMLAATDLAVGAYVDRGDPAAATVSGLWVLHDAVFAVLLTSIAVALLGLSAACVAAGRLPTWWKGLGLLSGLLLLISSATAPAMIDGSPTMFIGLVGFVVWLVFVVHNSVALLREPR